MRFFTELVAILAATAALACGSSTQSTQFQSPGEPYAGRVNHHGAPKPLGNSVARGLAWLASHEVAGGGWGQGDEAAHVREHEPGSANVADTSVALLAFLRAGHTPASGAHRDVVDGGLRYVMAQIEASDRDSLSVTSVRGTRVQSKIGQFVDTFAALMVLGEAKGKMKTAGDNARLEAALKKVVHKVEKNQKSNGTWDEQGWAPVLSQALAAKGMNRAAQNGIAVSDQVLSRIDDQTRNGSLNSTGNAGISLYGDATYNSNNYDFAVTQNLNVERLRNLPVPASAAELGAAVKAAEAANEVARRGEKALVAKLADPQFVQGFGNNGGEEYLSYMMISETLYQSGGPEWQRWDTAITKLVERVQNTDGSWVGQHCITGRTFNTAAALLVLMGDRSPAPTKLIAKK